MIKYLPFILLLFPIPSQAITWKEFWEPFNEWRPYHYPREIRVYEVCRKQVYREQYFPGDLYSPGYVKKWIETIQIPCK